MIQWDKTGDWTAIVAGSIVRDCDVGRSRYDLDRVIVPLVAGVGTMTALLEKAVDRVCGLSSDMQDDIARMMLTFTGDEQDLADLSPEDEAAVLKSRKAASRGEYATDEQVRAVWSKHGL